MPEIAWSRMACPQVDGSDTTALITLAMVRWGHVEPAFPRLLPSGPALAAPRQSPAAWLAPALDHPNLPAIAETLQLWPEGAAGLARFLTQFWPLDLYPPPEHPTKGCTSGHEVLPDGARAVYVTVHDVEGACEGLWHEWAHLRLEAMGIDLEAHDGELLTNGAGERYVSAIRKDVLRPLSAVLHGFYAWVMLTQGDLTIARLRGVEAVRSFLEWNLPKLEEGIAGLDAWARWTPAGEAFWRALRAWAMDVVSEGWLAVGHDRRARCLRANQDWIRTQPVDRSPLHDALAAIPLELAHA